MSAAVNRRIVLAARPRGAPKETDFRLVEGPVPAPGDGQVLCRTIYLSIDPYMRGRMSDAPSYTAPVQVGQPMVGGTVGEVLRSALPGYAPGDLVMGAGDKVATTDATQTQTTETMDRIASIANALNVLHSNHAAFHLVVLSMAMIVFPPLQLTAFTHLSNPKNRNKIG